MTASFLPRLRALALGLAATVTLGAAAASAGTLETVRQRGSLTCGVSTGLYGFSEQKPDGSWSGFDVDFCRALAAVVFNDPAKVTFVPLSAAVRFDALRDGTIDVLSRNSTWTLDREARLGLLFGAITFHDGQGFMAWRDLKIESALELSGRTICVQAGTTAAVLLPDFLTANGMKATVQTLPDAGATLGAFRTRACEVMTTDNSGLFAERLKLEKPGEAVILPDIISKEPLGPVVRSDDAAWFNVVKWVAFALINAEELGVTAANAAVAGQSAKPDVRRFAGVEGGHGRALGLTDDWALRAVAAVGNYAEIYERTVGTGSRLGIPRGLNQLWTQGGILFAPPIR